MALDVPRTDTEAWLPESQPLFAEFMVGEEQRVATLLTVGHVFFVNRVLDERGEQIRTLLQDSAAGARRLSRQHARVVYTGNLTKIFLFFAKARFRDGRTSSPGFWAAITAACELLTSEDGGAEALLRAGCHFRHGGLLRFWVVVGG
ncbi:hypothetical protein ACWD3Z_40840 [Streptomyces sp. NPDC002740]